MAKRCIGTYYALDNTYLLYQLNYLNPNWISNICYFDTTQQKYYSPNLANIAYNARDIDGQKRDEYYWTQYSTL
jgi:hypothetical protein